jgi:uncharacterized protein with HEPN domain
MGKLVRPALYTVLEAIRGIEAATAEKTLPEYQQDWILRHAIQRGVEIISEACRRIPEKMRQTQPEIPWRAILGIGNILRHEYDRISDEIIWNVVTEYLPSLKKAVEAIDASLQEKD